MILSLFLGFFKCDLRKYQVQIRTAIILNDTNVMKLSTMNVFILCIYFH